MFKHLGKGFGFYKRRPGVNFQNNLQVIFVIFEFLNLVKTVSAVLKSFPYLR